MSDSFAHLHVHTEYSMLDGAAKLKPLFAEAERLEMPAVAMTDHGNMFGAYEFWQTAKNSPVKPIIGIEAYVAPESRFLKKRVSWSQARQNGDESVEGGKDISGGGRYLHLTMWAQNAAGLRNLFRLSSLASIEGYYGKPRMDLELMAEHSEGIMVSTGCPSGGVQTRLRLGQEQEALQYAGTLTEIFGRDNVFVELMDHGIDIERQVREGVLNVGKRLGLKPVVTNDSHYVVESQADAHDSLLAVSVGKTKDDPNRFRFNGAGYYIKTADEMRGINAFDEWTEGCRNTLLIAERVEAGCYDEVFAERDLMPKFPVPEGETQSSCMRQKVEEGIRWRFPGGETKEIRDRIEYEIGIIEEMGFPAYFLVVADICMYAKNNGIAIGPGRGSATGSMVAYVMGITDLDPIDHGLIFERFLNPERVTMPDIDLDFDERRREDMIRYVTEMYGSANTAQILTFGVIKAKAAIKDSTRILGFPYALGDRITKAFPAAEGGKEIDLAAIWDSANKRYAEAVELRKMYDDEPDVKKVLDTAAGIEGLTRQTGVHAAGVILSSEPLLDVIPLHRRDSDGAIITGFPFPQCEEMGLLKMDFLGLRNLTVIDDAIKNVKANEGTEIDLQTLTLDDSSTYEMLSRGDTLGVFQLDGGGMRGLLRLMQPKKFDDIAAASALYRPGPMAANAHTNYALRSNGKQEIEPIHPELRDWLEPILGDTFHLLVFQEQVMAIAQQLGGYTLGGADLMRRAMGKKKKEALEKEYEKFHSGCLERGISEAAIKAVWDTMLPFSGYAFNKSHTGGYGVVSYWTAYLKANHPAAYMAALLTSVGDDQNRMPVYLAECRRSGIQVLPPDVNESAGTFAPIGKDIRFGLSAIRNVGTNVVNAIVETRETKGKFTSFADFLNKVPTVVCNKRVIESLIKAGAFDSLGHSRRPLMMHHESAVDAVISTKRQEQMGQFDLFGGGDDEAAEASVPMGLDLDLSGDEWDRKTKLSFEREMLGLYVSDHPLAGAERILSRAADTAITELGEGGRTEGEVTIAGMISSVARKVTKKGDSWAALVVEDMGASVECLCFPKSYMLYANELMEDAAVVIKGRLNERDGSVSVVVMDLSPLDISAAAVGGGEPPVTVRLEERRINPQLVEDLKHCLTVHRGETPLRLEVIRGPKAVLLDLSQYPVRVDPSFQGDLKSLIGPGALAS
ncbi:MAG TPA: DNA polymerase III subunit alpha [Streptosporangiaceae bacterium]